MNRVGQNPDQQAELNTDINSVGSEIVHRIAFLHRIFDRELEKAVSGHGLNTAKFDVLAALRRAGPPHVLTPGDLLTITGVASGTMTNRINRLVADGFVRRTRDSGDNRSFRIQLTDTGLDLIDHAAVTHADTQARLISRLTSNERRALARLLGKSLDQGA
ncbi:MAG: MarR family transcriptional regulator [Pseudomonadota bacterium]